MLTDNELFLAVEIMQSFPKSKSQQDSHSLVLSSLWKHILDTSSLSSHYLKWNIVTGQRSSVWMYICGGKKETKNLVCPAVFTCNILIKNIVPLIQKIASILLIPPKAVTSARILTVIPISDTTLIFTSLTNQICWIASLSCKKLYPVFISSIKDDIYEIIGT